MKIYCLSGISPVIVNKFNKFANNLSFKRGQEEIFKELSISLPPKKIIHLKGQNGIGKTTLIKIIVNILIPNTGEIYWNGKNIKKNLT